MASAAAVPATQVETHPGLSQMADLQKRLWHAERPIVIIAGGSGWSEAATERLRRFAERFELPVVCPFRRQMLFDHEHPNYAGDLGLGVNPKLVKRIKASNLVLLIGGRLSEIPSQSYTLFDIPSPSQTLIHVHAGAEELGRVYQPSLAIHASPEAFTAALEGVEPPVCVPWPEETKIANDAYHAWSDQPPATPGPLQMGEVMTWLRHNLSPEAILTNGAGNYATWVHRFYRFRKLGTQLAPTSGSMGYGLPAAISAKLRYPDRDVVCFAGDGCLQMTINELGTAQQAGAAVIVICVDNGIYGTIRMHQEREYPGRISATTMTNPDFAALVRAYGGHGETVTETAEFGPAFERVRASGELSLLHLRLDPEVITPTTTLSAIHKAALKRA